MNSDPFMRRRVGRGLALIAAASLLIATCGSDDESETSTTTTAPVEAIDPSLIVSIMDLPIIQRQRVLNFIGCSEEANGENLAEDGKWGSKSQAAMDLYIERFQGTNIPPGESDCNPATREG